MCTSDAWRHGDSVEHEPWRLELVRSGWTHDGHWIRQRAMETRFKYCDHQHVSSGCVRRSAFPGTGVCSEANTKVSSVAAMPCMVGRANSTGIAMMKFPAGLDD